MTQKDLGWFVWLETKLNEFSMMAKSAIFIMLGVFALQVLAGAALVFFGIVDTDFGLFGKAAKMYFSNFPEILFKKNEISMQISDIFSRTFDVAWRDLMKLLLFTSPFYIFAFFKIFKTLKFKSDEMGKGQFVRGSRLVSEEEQIKISKKLPHNFKLGKIPFPADAETMHVMIIGSSGAGKTQALKQIIPTAVQQKAKGLVHDIKGDWVAEYYDQSQDLILNPLDKRSVKWTIFNDIEDVMDLKNFATWIVPDLPGAKDPFWQNSARMILESMLMYCWSTDQTTNAHLRELLFKTPEELVEILKGYGRGAELAGKKDSFMTLQAQMAFIDFLPDGDFSFKKWVQSGNGLVYLSNTEKTQALMKPVLSLAVSVVSSAVLNLPDNRDNRFYFFLDEFTSLNKLDKVMDILKLGRSKGASVWLAFQDFQQLEKIYSREDMRTVINNTASIAVLRLKEPDAAMYFSKRFGKQEFIEKNQTISMGVAANRDGMSLTEQRRDDFVIKDSEILNLQVLNAFVMINGLEGITKTQIEIVKSEIKNLSLDMIELSKADQIKLLTSSSRAKESEIENTNLQELKNTENSDETDANKQDRNNEPEELNF